MIMTYRFLGGESRRLTWCYRGEQAATALERSLSSLENKLDELLAAFESGTQSKNEDSGQDSAKDKNGAEPSTNDKTDNGKA